MHKRGLLWKAAGDSKPLQALERAKKIAYIRGNSRNNVGANEEIMLSEIDVLE
jgi:hypothetical protein